MGRGTRPTRFAPNREATPVNEPRKRRWYQFSLRGLLGAFVVIALIFGACRWLDQKFGEPGRRDSAILKTIDSLAYKRPPELTRGQWSVAVGWTHNLHCNSLLFTQGKLHDIRQFQAELEERVEGDVSMETIHWIWDQYAELTECGQSYQRFREPMLQDMQTVGPNEDPCGIYSWNKP